MKYLLILSVVLGCSCAAKKGESGKNGQNGKDYDPALESRVANLENLYNALSSVVELLNTNAASTQARVDDLELINETYNSIISDIYTRLTSLEISNSTNETQITNIITDVTILQSVADTQISEVLDPCGDGAGHDEVLLKLGDGRIVAYFEQGGDRFLSVLSNGSYQTTDSQSCNFSVSSGVVNW